MGSILLFYKNTIQLPQVYEDSFQVTGFTPKMVMPFKKIVIPRIQKIISCEGGGERVQFNSDSTMLWSGGS